MQLQNIDIHNAITALSCTLDLVGIDEVRHGKRVAVMAWRIAGQLGWSGNDRLSSLYAGMLHDCGVSKIHEHHMLTATLEWDGAEAHCIRGAEYLGECSPLAHLATEIRYHHSRWEKLLALPLEPWLRLRANLLFLADRIDVLQAPFLNNSRILIEFPAIIARIESLSGVLFAPELVEAFSAIADLEAFWLAMEPEYLDEDLREIGGKIPGVMLNISELKELALLFSRVVDAKSPFTEEHSYKVALIARQLGEEFGIQGMKLEQLEIAGLLHDIGKLRVSEEIIDKPGKLTAEERATMSRHSYDTYRILQRVFGETKIPVWAGFHHETLSGSGYPFKTDTRALDLECRIIAVADIFQALAQDRPYRATMSLDFIVGHLQKRVADGLLDREVVAKIVANSEGYYRLATGA